MKLYLKTTNDQYELPLFVADNPKELAEMVGTTTNSVKSAISHKCAGWHRVEIDDLSGGYGR